MEKEWIDEEALKNPSKSLKDYGMVSCTKEKIGKGKHLIAVDCITESGPVPGALWIFSETKTEKECKITVQHIETAVEIQRWAEKQKEGGEEEETEINQPRSSTKVKVYNRQIVETTQTIWRKCKFYR